MFDGTTHIIGENLALSNDHIAKMNKKGSFDSRVSLINECREAVYQIPQGKRGLCVGSGWNTKSWKERGWDTLDIDPLVQAKFTANANRMVGVTGIKAYDYIYVEGITMNINEKEGITRGRLLQQANVALKTGGKLMIETADFGKNEKGSILPVAEDFLPLLVKHGFKAYIVINKPNDFNDSMVRTTDGIYVTYYAEKIADGFDEKRYPNATPLRLGKIR